MRYGFEWQPYVPIGRKKANARKFADKLAKNQKRNRQPIEIKGRKIANSFWGKAWCDHLESLSDYANRLPRGATYVRNGSVIDLVITPGKVDAIVAGSEPYKISFSINQLDQKVWDKIKQDCTSAIHSLIDLLGGRLSDGVMQRLVDKKSGCFPAANQISMKCSCPDSSRCCKHIAAVMYAIGNRLDSEPELLFLLRGVNHQELISQAISQENLDAELSAGSSDIANDDLGSIFGIEMDSLTPVEVATKPSKSKSATRKAKTGPRAKTAAKKKPEKLKSSSNKPKTKIAAAKTKTSASKKVTSKQALDLEVKKKSQVKKSNWAKEQPKPPKPATNRITAKKKRMKLAAVE